MLTLSLSTYKTTLLEWVQLDLGSGYTYTEHFINSFSNKRQSDLLNSNVNTYLVNILYFSNASAELQNSKYKKTTSNLTKQVKIFIGYIL